ncbi:MAG: glutamine--fructose-6-phosphate transaminase (isomerizing) [bacterium]
MCGIIGYVGTKKAAAVIMECLKNLEYRGYDSAGIAIVDKKKLFIMKCKGRISVLEGLLKKRNLPGGTGIGHTRWATHGKPSKINAHPHVDCLKRIAIVHNGIIENFGALKKELKKNGCKFKSETDTEVIAHLIGRFYKGNLEDAVRKALKKMKGSCAIGAISPQEPGKIVAARRDSPLSIGLGKDGNFITSDISSVLAHTRKVIHLLDNQTAVVTKNTVDIFDMDGNRAHKRIDTVSYTREAVHKEGFPHFMSKEIHEQPEVLSRIISCYITPSNKIRFGELDSDGKRNFLRRVENIVIIACGTAYHAGLVGKYALESFLRIPVTVDFGSEFRYRKCPIKEKTLVIAISQSGETADTLAAVREAKKKAKIISICNVLGSSLTRETDFTIYTQAGPEISVASTKAYTAQVMLIYILGLYLAGLKNTLSGKFIRSAINMLREIPSKQKKIIRDSRNIKAIAEKHLHFGSFLYLGRNVNYPTALEGALKLKELSYIPAEGYPAGEMKHGPIALIDEYRAVICIANKSFIFDKMISNIQEILARSGKIIAVATSGDKRIKDHVKEVLFIPDIEDIFSPLLTIIPLQFLAYYIAVLKGYDVDKPRNLAKSVTVE